MDLIAITAEERPGEHICVIIVQLQKSKSSSRKRCNGHKTFTNFKVIKRPYCLIKVFFVGVGIKNSIWSMENEERMQLKRAVIWVRIV